MKKINLFLLASVNLFFIHSTSAALLECPPEDVIKSANLIEAKQHSFDPDCWNFLSNNFEYAGLKWNVVFGSFFPTAKNQSDALKQGQAYFKKSSLKIKHPMPDEFDDHVVCDYMSTGEEFWLSAVSPPEQIPPS